MTETQLWEYQVLTIGNVFGTKDEKIQETLNDWGMQGWEVTMCTPPRKAPRLPS